MDSVDTPIRLEITEEQLQGLADGETMEIVLDTDSPMTDFLEIRSGTRGETDGSLYESVMEGFE